MMDISVHNSTIGSDYKITTALYLHPGVIIYFTRAQPIQFANSLVGHWTWYNQTSPTVTISLAHGFTAKQRNMTDIFDPLGLDPSIQTAMKTNSDKEILSLAEMKTGNIRFDSSHFIVTPPNNNGSSCIADEYALSCVPGDWSITPNNDALKSYILCRFVFKRPRTCRSTITIATQECTKFWCYHLDIQICDSRANNSNGQSWRYYLLFEGLSGQDDTSCKFGWYLEILY